MNSITSNKDFPSAGSFVYLNAANVGLMYSEAEKVMKEWHKDLAYNGSNNSVSYTHLTLPTSDLV